jgi:hypothetical protein
LVVPSVGQARMFRPHIDSIDDFQRRRVERSEHLRSCPKTEVLSEIRKDQPARWQVRTSNSTLAKAPLRSSWATAADKRRRVVAGVPLVSSLRARMVMVCRGIVGPERGCPPGSCPPET